MANRQIGWSSESNLLHTILQQLKRLTKVTSVNGGVTDHTLLTNIGVKTHPTLDTEVGLNNAKISFDVTSSTRLANTSGTNTGDQVGDGVTITGAGTIGDPFVSAGGGKQIYSLPFWVDNPNTTNYAGWGKAKLGHEIDVNTVINFTSGSMVTYTNFNLINPIGVAVADQTIVRLCFNLQGYTDIIKKISLLKVKYLTQSPGITFSYVTILYEGALIPAPPALTGIYEIPAASFAVTSISKNDLIFFFVGADNINDVQGGRVELYTTIN